MRAVRGEIIITAAAAVGLLFWLGAGSGTANPAAGKVKEGNKYYAAGKYDQALTSYGKAQQENPAAPEIYFNIGDVQYRKKDYPKAASLFQKSGRDRNRLLKSQAYYNLGNTYFKAKDLAKALAAYKKSIELNPKDRDAKFNYELTRLKQKKQQQKPKQQQKQQQKKKQPQKKKQKKEPPPKPKPSPGEKQKQQQLKPPPSGSPRQTPAPQPQPQEMTKKDVNRLLNALQNQEENKRQEVKRREKSSQPEVLKDW